ncbi:MAG: YbaB/EbfC family nucleoid-associated protein [Rickettsiaceae bacterium]|nr:YbaB/EbfC family nucleoid-associated protein [Rickettsiaceae bacterium]MDP4832660.1 YbaB/EbfC family nucleoid-associated protein [Rickettsiaceae bacterium]MDP5020280.1 YbaB/EbfC family nucleoid-associated protein [Rickettsiaceae bacterium]MDP5083701.1 YbaB/EbfC family nucleoid-associated protein [Rickettsiaceae bacterium]
MNINQLMKQAQSMQKKMKEMQEEIASKEFEGKAGGGLISVVMSGAGEMRKVSIDPSLIQSDDKEMLEDLIVAAHNEAKTKADEESKNNMSGAFGDMGGLPGMNF